MKASQRLPERQEQEEEEEEEEEEGKERKYHTQLLKLSEPVLAAPNEAVVRGVSEYQTPHAKVAELSASPARSKEVDVWTSKSSYRNNGLTAGA